MRGLSIADQQMVELAAALQQQSRLLLMDEPTAALTPAEVEDLFRIVRRLRTEGIAMVFISHRLEEVLAISDRITVLRDGQFGSPQSSPVATMDAKKIISLMVGRPLSEVYEKETASLGEAAFARLMDSAVLIFSRMFLCKSDVAKLLALQD